MLRYVTRQAWDEDRRAFDRRDYQWPVQGDGADYGRENPDERELGTRLRGCRLLRDRAARISLGLSHHVVLGLFVVHGAVAVEATFHPFVGRDVPACADGNRPGLKSQEEDRCDKSLSQAHLQEDVSAVRPCQRGCPVGC